jgi:hypothetical protein
VEEGGKLGQLPTSPVEVYAKTVEKNTIGRL